ncbi:MAG TPA: tetratricopeptide repeat protein [Candidatus Acidoferrales bacterium]|nr:tetratricopeptide repeat protein [Candidatus Acidoferrales bacterium]
MPQHISRRELKTDQVQDALAHSAEAVLSHQTILIYIVAAAVVVGLGVFGWRSYSERQSMRATTDFSEAMRTFEAPVLTAGQNPTPGEISYSQSSSKFQDALKKFQDVASHYSRTRSGQLAHYYAALCLERLNQDSQAIPWLTGMEKGADPDFAAMARFELAQIYDRQGKSDQAVALFNQLLNASSVFVPKPVVLLALAEHYSQSNPAQAVKFYNQIKSEFPDTAAADQADQALALLPSGKS